MISSTTRINIDKLQMLMLLLLITIANTHTMVSQSQTQTNFTTIPLNTIISIDQQAYTSKYYQTTIPNPYSDQILTITVSSDIQSYIGIYVSTSNSPDFKNGTWPSWQSYTQECFYSSIDTCALRLPDMPGKELLVYFTVVIGDQDSSYKLEVGVQTVYQIKSGHKYSVTFNQVEAAILELPGSYFTSDSGEAVQQIVITCTYVSYRDIGHYQLLAEENQIPNPSHLKVTKSKSLNAMTQILQLDPIESNSSYYILIQGQNSTKFNLSVKSITSLTNPQLNINESISYLAKRQVNYSYHSLIDTSANATALKPLYIQLFAYRGYGKFIIEYCNGLYNYTFENTGGENGQVEISVSMRQECVDKISSEGGLLIENLVVGVAEIGYEFGYQIGLYEGQFFGFLYPGLKEIGVVKLAQNETYQIAAFGDNVTMNLVAQALVGSINISIYQCQQQTTQNNTKRIQCKRLTNTTLSQGINSIAKLPFTCPTKYFCQVRITQTDPTQSYSKYTVTVSFASEQSRQLLPNTPQFDIVEMNQYVHYFINLTALRMNPDYKISNSTSINVRNTLVNGEVVLLSSVSIEQPVFKDLFNDNSDVVYGYEGAITYYINTTTPDYIYIGVLGDTESIYHIQFTVNTSANIPAAYLSLIDDSANKFQITPQTPYILTKYISHIFPYSITFDPVPTCITYSPSLPIPLTCVSPNELPTQFHYPVIYFNISQKLATPTAVFKFSVYANSGSYVLVDGRPVLIGCDRECYEIVTVLVDKSQVSILHNGDGHIVRVPASENQEVNNGALTISCPSLNCTVQINATLRYGGEMQLAFQSNLASQIDWRTKPMSLPSQSEYNLYFMKLPKYRQSNSLIFYAEAAELTVYYNIISLNESYTNTINYTYPNSSSFMGVSHGDPLQEIHVVDLDDGLIEKYQCRERNVVCVVTVAVGLNSSVEYSQQYVNSGLGYYSANTYHYEISESWPILKLRQQYSLSYFTHKIDYSKQPSSMQYTIHIQSLSNCRPQIQTESTYYTQNYYTDVTLPRAMPGQKTVNYRVLSNQVCLFNTAITNIPYQLFFPNIQYSVKVDNNTRRIVFVYQHSLVSTSFTISTKEKVSSIIINKAQFTDPSQGQQTIILPTLQNNLAYTQNTSSLTLVSPDYDQYIVVVNFNNPSVKSMIVPIIVKLQYDPIILLHNQQHTYVYDPTDNSISASTGNVVQYQYHSTSNFLLFVAVNRLQVRITVRDANIYDSDQSIIDTVITNTSLPWIPITLNPQSNFSSTSLKILTNYRIKCQFLGTLEPGYKSTFRIHIEQSGVAGLTQVYPGVSIYDAFVHDSAMNCYKFVPPMLLGENDVVVDLNFAGYQKDVEGDGLAVVRGIVSLVDKNNKNIQVKQIRISPSAYRLTFDYVFGSTYKICFELTSVDMLGKQYSLIVNVPSMPIIYDNQYIRLLTVYSNPYQMFQYINNQYNTYQYQYDTVGKPVTFTVTSCYYNPSTILASQSYQNMQTGQMTQVGQYWSKNGVTTSLIDVPHGYYYFGVKTAGSSAGAGQKFRVNIQRASIVGRKPVLLEAYYFINWNIKAKLYQIEKNSSLYIILQVPSIIKSKSAQNIPNPSKIVYYLYSLNLFTSQNKSIHYAYSIDNYARCPSLYSTPQSNITHLAPTLTITVQDPLNPKVFQQRVVFSLSVQKLSKQSNISIKAEVYIEDETNTTNVLEYFYGHAEIMFVDDGDGYWGVIRWIFVVAVLFTCVGGGAVFVKYYLRKRGRNVSFEMAEYPVGPDGQTRRNSRRNSQPEPAPQPTVQVNNTTVTSNRRPLNSNSGYGEFVDEVV